VAKAAETSAKPRAGHRELEQLAFSVIDESREKNTRREADEALERDRMVSYLYWPAILAMPMSWKTVVRAKP